MGLECLLLTRDSALLGRIRAKFSELGIEILVRKDATLAVELSKRRHLDGFVIDCDEVPAGKEALSNIPGNPANKRSVMVAVVSGGTSVSEAIERGANRLLRGSQEIARFTPSSWTFSSAAESRTTRGVHSSFRCRAIDWAG